MHFVVSSNTVESYTFNILGAATEPKYSARFMRDALLDNFAHHTTNVLLHKCIATVLGRDAPVHQGVS